MSTPPRSRVRTSRALLRGIAVVYAVAFTSLGVQIEGLYGSGGILPAAKYLEWYSERAGENAWQTFPTLFWFGASDGALVGACWLGAAFAAALFAGVMPTLSAAACWILYLSLFQIGRVFLGFQWDILLLEAGFLAIFLAPLRLRQRGEFDPEPSTVAVWMFRWLVFRLMFASGAVKLASNDAAWWNLTSLEYHYWTQPLPTWTAWIAHQLPPLVQRVSVAVMFFVELVVPWLVFGPRRARLVAFVLLLALQILIALTGNYGFFNLLTGVLLISLLDDDALTSLHSRVRPDRTIVGRWPGEERNWTYPAAAARMLAIAVALPLAVAGGALMVGRLRGFAEMPREVVTLVEAIEPWHLTSSYGLFAVMTKSRNEVVIEGSNDGEHWVEYPFCYKPGAVAEAPPFIAPHQPRLDWQMWFAALGDWRRSPWLVEFERRLLDGSPAVVGLLAFDPFAGRPPRYVRAMLYEYRFTTMHERNETDTWWRRRLIGPFSPPLERGKS